MQTIELYEITGISGKDSRVTIGWSLDEPITEQYQANYVVSHDPVTFMLPEIGGYHVVENREGVFQLYNDKNQPCEIVVGHDSGLPQIIDGESKLPELQPKERRKS